MDLATIKMQCIECYELKPVTELRLIWPKKAFRFITFTDEPDFFCEPCVVALGLSDLKQHNKADWLRC